MAAARSARPPRRPPDPLRLLAAAAAAAAALAPGAAGDDDDDYYYTGPEACARLAPYYRRVNGLAIAQSVVGGVGAVLCGLGALHIVARGRDRRSLATRIVLGVLLCNLVYAVTDAVPTTLYHTSGALCDFTVIGPRNTDVAAQCLPDAAMFAGVYSTTAYELMMVLVSTHALRTGAGAIPRAWERALHLGCAGAGAAALLGYYLRCRALELDAAALIAEAGAADGRNWTAAQTARGAELGTERTGLPGLLWGWALLPVGAALLVWVYQRLLFRELRAAARAAAAQLAAYERTDPLARIGLDPSVGAKERLLGLRQQAHAEVVRPLERYVGVILAFALPQIVAVTPGCQAQTQRALLQGQNGVADAALPCENVAAFVLAWRAVFLGLLYLLPDPAVRAQALNVPDLCHRVWRRLVGASAGGDRIRFAASAELDGAGLVPADADAEGRPGSYGRADRDVERMGAMACERLFELDDAAAASAQAEADEDGADRDPADSQVPYQRME